MKFKIFCTSLFSALFFYTCVPSPDDFEITKYPKSVAVPILYGNLDLYDVVDRANGDASLKVDGEGRLTALYSGELLRDNATKIFPPVPGLLDFPILTSPQELPLPLNNPNYKIDKGVFDNVNIFFKITHAFPEVLKIKISIPNVTKDNKIWSETYNLDFTAAPNTTIATTPSNLDKWLALPQSNKIKFEFEATRPNGEKITPGIAMRFDVLRFAYLEGYFGNHSFDIKGDVIKINIFDQWKSGGVEFLNPLIKLDVDNAFGFPVRSKVNQLLVKTVSNQLLNVESVYINKGIDFNYPSINEIGAVKNTKFQFDSSNSNVGTLFKDKVTEVIYDFDALANPDGDNGNKNFFTSQSYFSVKVDVELPMEVKANTFVIQDTFDFDLTSYQEPVQSVEFKLILENSFPVDLDLDLVFLDGAGKVLDELKGTEEIAIDAAPSNYTTGGKTTKIIFIKMDKARYDKLLNAKNILTTASFDTSKKYDKPVWIYKNSSLNVKLGAIINFL